jgi:hypothetical protein
MRINERDCRSSTVALHVHVLLEDVFLVEMKEMCLTGMVAGPSDP